MYSIKDIHLHRERKLKSLIDGQLEQELLDFKQALEIFNPEEKTAVWEIYDFASKQNYDQGKFAHTYISHPLRVCLFLLDWQRERGIKHLDQIKASLIHNIIEKKVLSPKQVAEKFGAWISEAIVVLTPDREKIKTPEGMKAYYDDILGHDQFVQVLKVFDKMDNIYSICLEPNEAIRGKYLDEIDEFIKPIVQEYAPTMFDYFNALVKNAREFGYFSRPRA